MPTIEQNRETWDADYDWPGGGDEWSEAWGGVRMQWQGVLMPRLQGLLPAGTILEIAPGYGRITQFLEGQCERLVLVDLSETCIEACRRRFASCSHISYHVNDGVSLAMVEDGSVDLAFSFDSLVHAERGVLASYLAQLRRKLTAGGAIFIHHSNLGEYPVQASLQRVPVLRGALRALGLLERNLHWRSPDMTAGRMAALAREHGLRCIAQELVNWGTAEALIDCFSLIVREDSPRARENRVFRNGGFMDQARQLAELARLYGHSPD